MIWTPAIQQEDKQNHVEEVEEIALEESETQIQKEVLAKPDNFFGKVFRTLEDPSYSILAQVCSYVIMFFVITSTITFLVGSLPQYWENGSEALTVIEWIVIVTFTVEYLLRAFTCWTYYKPWIWFIKPLNLIDLVAIIPFYIELGTQNDVAALAAVRILRLFRIVRLLKLGKYSEVVLIIVQVFRISGAGLLSFSILILLATVVMSSLLFFAESSGAEFDNVTQTWFYKDNNASSPFESIPATMWCVVVTMTTVGYGDMYPRTDWGKLVGAITICMGLVTIAFPITMIGSAFQDVWSEYQHRKKLEALTKPRKKKKVAKLNPHKVQQDIADLLGKVMEKQQLLDAYFKKLETASDQLSSSYSSCSEEEGSKSPATNSE
jgi:hypothetical protein